LLSGSCRGFQKLLDICAEFGQKWDICFNAEKSQILTLGGHNPDRNLLLDSRPLQWVNKVKYLGMHILAGGVQKVDTTNAKTKYCGCFNSILSVCGNNRNDLVSHTSSNHTGYHVSCMVVKAYHSVFCSYMN